jgi:hypothetical protein
MRALKKSMEPWHRRRMVKQVRGGQLVVVDGAKKKKQSGHDGGREEVIFE